MRRSQTCADHGTWQPTCPPCRQAKREYMHDYRYSQYKGERLSYPAEICGQRLRELRALGYSIRFLAERCDLPKKTVWLICERDQEWVQLGTFQSVAAAYTELRDWPGPSTYARRSAEKRGWTPPALPAAPAAPTEDAVDPVAVERVVAGDDSVCLTRAEKVAAWDLLGEQGMSASERIRFLRVGEHSIARWRGGFTRKKRTA